MKSQKLTEETNMSEHTQSSSESDDEIDADDLVKTWTESEDEDEMEIDDGESEQELSPEFLKRKEQVDKMLKVLEVREEEPLSDIATESEKLIKELEGDQPFLGLRRYSRVLEDADAKTSLEGVKMLLKLSPHCDHILNILRKSKMNHLNAQLIFSILGTILMKISSKLKSHESTALHITKDILENHLEIFTSPLFEEAIYVKNVQATLQCLTGMVSSGSAAAGEVLEHVNFDGIQFSYWASSRSQELEIDLRTYLTMLIIAFLNVNDNDVVGKFLRVKDFMGSIFKGLINDPLKIIMRLIKLIYEKIVLNAGISHSDRLEAFNFHNCLNLLELYNWEQTENKEREKIIELMEKIMYIILIDSDRGIVFGEEPSQTSNIQKVNNELLRVLNHSNKVWRTIEGRELIAATVLTRRDILKSFNYSVRKYISKPTEGFEFITLMQLYAQIIVRSDPIKELRDMTRPLNINLYKDKFFPIQYSLIKEVLSQNSFIMKYVGTNVLVAYLRKIETIMNQVNNMENLTPFEKKSICELITQEIIEDQMLPRILKNNWDKFLKEDWIKDKWTRTGLLLSSNLHVFSSVVESVTLYADVCNMKPFLADLDLVKMLARVVKFKKTEKEENIDTFLKIVGNVLKFMHSIRLESILDMDFRSLNTYSDNDLKSQLLYILISTYGVIVEFRGTDESLNICITEIQDFCAILLTRVLSVYGISYVHPDEPKLWLNTAQSSDRLELNLFFTNIVIHTATNLARLLDKIFKLNKIKCESPLLRGNLCSDLNNLESKDLEDNSIVIQSNFGLSFSCLVAGASDLIKEKSPENLYINYFSSIVGNYIHYVDDPYFLSHYLIMEDVPLTQSTKLYIQSFYNTNRGLEDIQSCEFGDLKEFSERLRYIFIMRCDPSIFEFDFKKEFNNDKHILYIIKQILCYIRLESKWKVDKEKKWCYEFFVMVLKNAVETVLLNERNFQTLSLMKFLINEHVILDLYSPFRGDSDFSKIIDQVIAFVVTKEESMIKSLIPFIDKMISCLEDSVKLGVDLYKSVDIYLKTKTLTFDNVENMLKLCFNSTNFENDSLVKLINILLMLIVNYIERCSPSSKFVEFIFEKFTFLKVKLEDNLSNIELNSMMMLLGEVLAKISSINNNFCTDEKSFEKLIECQPFCLPLCCLLIKTHPECVPIFAENLGKLDLRLSLHAPLINALMTDNIEQLIPCIEKLKGELINWCLNEESTRENQYETLLTQLLSIDYFESGEISNVCHFWFQNIVEEKNLPPLHIVNLFPVFKYFHTKGIKSSMEYHIKALKISLMSIRKLYGRDEKIEKYGIGIIQEIVGVIQTLGKEIGEDLRRIQFYLDPIWNSFVKKILRTGFTDKEMGIILINCLTELTKLIYDSSSPNLDDTGLPLTLLFEMVRSHSEYIEIMLTEDHDFIPIKEKIVQLLNVIVEVEPKVASEKDIPLLFAAYHATRSSCDQELLKLIMVYERNGCMPIFAPMLWGDAALNHFAVQDPDAINSVLLPRVSQSLSLIDDAKVVKTALKFETSMGLEPAEIFGDDSSIYDQRFLLMLFIHLTSEDEYFEVMGFIEKGCLSIAFAALTSEEKGVWLAGATLLKNIAGLFEKTRHVNLKQLWLWMTYVFCYAMNGTHTILPSIMSSFLIKASQMMNKPEELLHWPIVNHIYLKPSLDFNKIPEFYQLYFSESLTSNFEERVFLLQYLSNGIKNEIDLNIAIKCYVPRMVLGLLSSPFASSKLKVEALNVVRSLVAVPRGACILSLDNGLVSQLSSSINTFELTVNTAIYLAIAVEIVRTTFNSVLKSFKETCAIEMGKSVKRKRNDNDANFKKKSKKQKLENGKVEEISISQHQDLKRLSESNIQTYFTEVLFFMGKAVPLFLEYIPNESMVSCFEFVMEILEASVNSKPGILVSQNIVKLQVRNWIDKSLIKRRLHANLTDYDQFLLEKSKNSAKYEENKIMFRLRKTEESNSADDLLKVTRSIFERINNPGNIASTVR